MIDDARFLYLLDDLILGFSCNNLTKETGGFDELASSITLVLETNQLKTCVSQRKAIIFHRNKLLRLK